MLRIGIDLGGTKTEIAALDRGRARSSFAAAIPTPAGEYEDAVRRVAAL